MLPAHTFWFFARYGVVGVVGAVLQTLTLYIWVELLRQQDHYLLGAVAGFCIALSVTFLLQKHWTFRDPAHAKAPRQFIIYTVIALGSLGLNILLLYISKGVFEKLGFDFFTMWYLLAQVGITGIIAGLSFCANYLITFRTLHEQDRNPAANV